MISSAKSVTPQGNSLPETSGPICPICAARQGEPVLLKRVFFRDSEDVYACQTGNCRFARCVPVHWNPEPPKCCTSHHLDGKPAVCVEISDGRHESAYRLKRHYRCPLPNCNQMHSLQRPSAKQRENLEKEIARQSTIKASQILVDQESLEPSLA
jgi:hypothetical protein